MGQLPLDGVTHPLSKVIDHNERTDYAALDRLREELKDYDGVIIGHNLAYDLGVLLAKGVTAPKAKVFDTFIGLRCYNENETRNDLKSWATYQGYPPYWHKFQKALDTIGAENLPIPDLEEYNAYDLCANADLAAWLTPRIKQEAIFRLECDTVPLVARMQAHGLKIDTNQLEYHYQRLDHEANEIERKLSAKYGEINLDSHPQVARLLYDRLGIEPIRGEERSTREEILKKLRHPVAKTLLRRRKIRKLVSSYLNPLADAMDEDNVIRGDFMIHGTETGRFTCRKPPLQTVPEELRDMFVPQYGVFVWVDFKQLEYRIIADIFGEQKLIDAIKAGKDVHAATAEQLFGSADPDKRGQAKTINFAIVYGAGAFLVSQQTGLSFTRAEELLAHHAFEFPHIHAGIAAIHQQVARGDVIVSPFGRRRHFSLDVQRVDRAALRKMQREGFNSIPQGMGHDILLDTWHALDDALRAEGITYEFANDVHDELLIDTDPVTLDKTLAVCHSVTEDTVRRIERRFGYRFQVPIGATVSHGEHWK